MSDSTRTGAYYAFYFYKFDSPKVKDLTCWKNDKQSISNVVNHLKDNGSPGPHKHQFNLKKEEFMVMLKTIVEDKKDADFLFVYILSHGDDEACLLTSDMEKVSLYEILDMFRDENCPRFRGKPKLFIIQACHGNDTLEMITGERQLHHFVIPQTEKSWDDEVRRIREHMGANMFFAYAATPGKFAYNPKGGGSFFTTMFGETICDGMETDLMKIMTLVNKRMSENEFEYKNTKACMLSFFVSRLSTNFNVRVITDRFMCSKYSIT